VSQISLPFTFSPDTLIKSGQVNADFAVIVGVVNAGIDNTNIGTAGIYASQIIPITILEATFGGGVPYTFTQALSAAQLNSGTSFLGPSSGGVNGPLQSSVSTGATQGYVPPMYSFSGAALAGTTHIAEGKVAIPVASGRAAVSTVVALSGAAVFFAEPNVQATPFASISVPGWTAGGTIAAIPIGPAPYSQIQVNLESNNGTNASTTVSVPAYVVAMGA
jgi:hypothetical protein